MDELKLVEALLTDVEEYLDAVGRQLGVRKLVAFDEAVVVLDDTEPGVPKGLACSSALEMMADTLGLATGMAVFLRS